MLKRHYSWVILSISVLVGMAAIGLARFGYTMILPSMKEGLGISGVQAGDLATGNLEVIWCWRYSAVYWLPVLVRG